MDLDLSAFNKNLSKKKDNKDLNLTAFSLKQPTQSAQKQRMLDIQEQTQKAVAKYGEDKVVDLSAFGQKPYVKESKIKDIWDTLRKGSSEIALNTKNFILTTLPNNLFEHGILSDELSFDWQAEPIINTEELYKNHLKDKFRKTYTKAEERHNQWLGNHPEFNKRPEYRGSIIKNIKEKPSLLLDPGYWGEMTAQTIPYSLAAAGTLALTKNPWAAAAVVMPAIGGDLKNELMANGATESQADQVTMVLAPLLAGVEVLGDMPLVGSLIPKFKKKFLGEATEEIAGSLFKRGAKTFAKIEAAETLEEITQEGITNAAVHTFNKERGFLENIPEVTVQTLMAVAPLGLGGGIVDVKQEQKRQLQERKIEFAKQERDRAVTQERLPTTDMQRQIDRANDFYDYKSRNKELPVEPFEGFEDLSLKFLQEIEGKSEVTRQFVEDYKDSPGVRAGERAVLEEVLEEYEEEETAPKEITVSKEIGEHPPETFRSFDEIERVQKVQTDNFSGEVKSSMPSLVKAMQDWVQKEDVEARGKALNMVSQNRELFDFIRNKWSGYKDLGFDSLKEFLNSKVKVYRSGPKPGRANSFFLSKGVSREFAERTGLHDVIEYETYGKYIVPTPSGSGEVIIDESDLDKTRAVRELSIPLKPEAKKIPAKEFAEKVQGRLIPLANSDYEKTTEARSAPYRNYTLDLGDDYKVAIYESPFPNDAVEKHFRSRTAKFPNYFAHTRYTDETGVAEGDIRWMQEMQSDLFETSYISDIEARIANRLTGRLGLEEGQKLTIKIPDAWNEREQRLNTNALHVMFRRATAIDQELKNTMKEKYAGEEIEVEYLGETAVGSPGMGNAYLVRFAAPSENLSDELPSNVTEFEQSVYYDLRISPALIQNPEIKERVNDLLLKENYPQLYAYKNIWEERIVREEIKRAAKDGFDFLRFPAGEAAMKIEQQISQDTEVIPDRYIITPELEGKASIEDRAEKLTTENIEVGTKYKTGGLGHDDWIVTGVSGNTFKAISMAHYKSEIVPEMKKGKSFKDALQVKDEASGRTLKEINSASFSLGKGWIYKGREATGEDLKRGNLLKGAGGAWLVTDNINNNRFKAIKKYDFQILKEEKYELHKIFDMDLADITIKDVLNRDIELSPENESEQRRAITNVINVILNMRETFELNAQENIKSHPIYKRYEHTIKEYLDKFKNPKVVRDDYGNKWWEVDISEEDLGPVYAYKEESIAETKEEEFNRKQDRYNRKIKGNWRDRVDWDITIEEARKILRRFFDEDEVNFITFKYATIKDGNVTLGMHYASMIKILENNGKISSSVLYHESFHHYFRTFITPTMREGYTNLVKEQQGIEGVIEAEEYMADKFADYIADESSVTGRLRRLFQQMKARIMRWLSKERQVVDLFNDIVNKKRIDKMVEPLPNINIKRGPTGFTKEKVDLSKVPDVNSDINSAYEARGKLDNPFLDDRTEALSNYWNEFHKAREENPLVYERVRRDRLSDVFDMDYHDIPNAITVYRASKDGEVGIEVEPEEGVPQTILDNFTLDREVAEQHTDKDSEVVTRYINKRRMPAISEDTFGVDQEVIIPTEYLATARLKTIKPEGEEGKELQPLAREAQKYDSAEEFVEAQESVYRSEKLHPVYKGKMSWGEGKYFGFDKSQVAEMTTDPGAKYKTPENIPDYGSVKEYIIPPNLNLKTINIEEMSPKAFNAMPRGNDLKNEIIEEGYDGVILDTGGDLNLGGDQVVIYQNTNQIKTRSQLKDFYNQATQKPTEAVKSQEEFDDISQYELMDMSKKGEGDYNVGDIYEAKTEYGRRLYVVSHKYGDGTVDGYYVGDAFSELNELNSYANLTSKKFENPEEHLEITDIPVETLNNYIGRTFAIDSKLTPEALEAIREKTTKEVQEASTFEVGEDPIVDIVNGETNMRIPKREKTDWKETVGTYWSNIFRKNTSLQAPDEMADELNMTENELRDKIEDEILRRQNSEEVSDDVKEQVQQLKKTEEMQNISDELKKKINPAFRPSRKKTSRMFGLLGNKDTTVPLFHDIFANWVNSGVDTIIEPYAGAFTLGTHSLDQAIRDGLKKFHSNIFDKEKYIIVQSIKDGNILDVEAALDNSVDALDDNIMKYAENDAVVSRVLNEFKDKYPEYFIGSDEWAKFMKNKKVGKEVTIYDELRKRFSSVFQDAIDELYEEDVTDLGTAMNKALIEKIGLYNQSSQSLVTSKGFKSFENKVYGNYGMLEGLRDTNDTFRLADVNDTKIELYSEDGEKFIKRFKKKESDKIGYYLDPPYINSSDVYEAKAEEQETPLDKFGDPKEYYEAHKSVFEAQKKGGRVALTNDVHEDYLNLMLGKIDDASIYAYREGQTPTSLVSDKETSNRIEEFFKRAEEIRKEYRSKRELINSLLEKGELTRTALQRSKKKIGLDKPITMATEMQLDRVIKDIKERINYKRKHDMKVNDKKNKVPQLPEEDYQKAAKGESVKERIKRKIKSILEKAGKTADEYVGVLSTQLQEIHPSLKRAMRRLENNVLKKKKGRSESITDFAKKYNKLDKKTKKILDLAMKNRDTKRINNILEKHEMVEPYKKVRAVLDEMIEEEKEVQFDVEYMEDYIPRMIKDSESFVEYFANSDSWGIIEKAIRKKEAKIGEALSLEEKAQLIQSMIRGFGGSRIMLSGIGNLKNRKIDRITPEMNKLYYDSVESLLHYINQMTEVIEARKFFGKDLEMDEDTGFLDMEGTIGAYTAKLVQEGKISIQDEIKLRNLLQHRFNPQGAHGFLQTATNIMYMTILGNPYNAVTQLGDLAFAMYDSGVPTALWEAVRAAVNKGELKKEDINLGRHIAQELSSVRGTARILNLAFKVSGFEKIDAIGKEALINSALKKYRKRAKEGDPDLLKELEEYFGYEVKGSTALDVLRELKKDTDIVTGNEKFLAFNKLCDFQPLTLSEVPPKYIDAGNKRIFWRLKTWTLKKFDVYRQEVYHQIEEGNAKQGIKNFLRLSAFLLLMDAGADEIKDWMLGRHVSFKDRVIDNILKLFGFSRYTTHMMSEEGAFSAIWNYITPPFNFIDDIYKDAVDSFKDPDEAFKINNKRSIKDIPLGGKLYYWWFGRGKPIKEKYYQKPGPADIKEKYEKKAEEIKEKYKSEAEDIKEKYQKAEDIKEKYQIK